MLFECVSQLRHHSLCAILSFLLPYINTTTPYYIWYQGLYSLSGKTSYRKISWSLEAARFGFKLFQSLWNLAGTSAALLSNFRAIRPLQHPISRLRDFTRFGGKTYYRLVNRTPQAESHRPCPPTHRIYKTALTYQLPSRNPESWYRWVSTRKT